MEAIGQLAGGVAHDFNNLLTVITGYSELLSYQLTDDNLRQDVEQIQKAGERAAALPRQLLAFSRRQVLQPKVLDLNSVIAEMEKMLRRLIGENIELFTMFGSPLGRVKADPDQIEQVVMNLAVNAWDAMPQGGKLTVETTNVILDEGYAREHIGVEPGPYVMLAVSDTGVGMNADTKTRIFEPFFTTKGSDKDTGLGLATVYGIVTQSGGSIKVYSEPGKGTTFRIYLPSIEEVTGKSKSNAAHFELPRGSETVLLVEDEEGVRELAGDVLQRTGYKILKASNGCEALRLCEQRKDPIDLLLADVVMPEMGGQELAEQLLPQFPEMKVLYMSGYTDNAMVHQGVLEANKAFIQKPFTPEALARKVRGVLDN